MSLISWVTGDEVYGSDRNLRLWLEQEGIPHVLAIKSNEKLWVWTEKGPLQVRADRLAGPSRGNRLGQVQRGRWSQGVPAIRLGHRGDTAPGEPGRGYWLLARRSIAKPDELAYYVCFGPSGTAMAELVKVAGRRWAIEECFEEAKGQVGLDQYEVTQMGCLVSPYHPGDAGPRLSGGDQASGVGTRMLWRKGGRPGSDARLIPLTVPEVRRLITRLVWTVHHPADFVLSWSQWRRRHQARARQSHYQRRLSLLAPVVLL